MKELHPSIVKNFLNKIPDSTAILGIEQIDHLTFALLVELDGTEQRLEVSKALLNDRFRGGSVDVKAPAGTTVCDILKKLSNDYALYWVEGIDYPVDDTVAEWTIQFEVPSTSFMWRGGVTINVYPSEERNKDPIKIPLSTAKTVLLLTRNIFKGEGSFLTNKGNLAQKAAEAIVEYLLKFGDTTYTLKELAGCKVVKVFADTFSSIAILEVKNKGSVFIRFDYEKDNVTDPSNR